MKIDPEMMNMKQVKTMNTLERNSLPSTLPYLVFSL